MSPLNKHPCIEGVASRAALVYKVKIILPTNCQLFGHIKISLFQLALYLKHWQIPTVTNVNNTPISCSGIYFSKMQATSTELGQTF